MPNIQAAAHLRQAPPGVAGPHVPAAQVKTLLPDNIDWLPRVRLFQTFLLQKSTSLLPDNSDRLLHVQLYQTFLLHKSKSLLLDN